MKEVRDYTQKELAGIKETIFTSAITGGPNALDLALALIGKKKVHFWLDDTAKINVQLKSLVAIDEEFRSVWEVGGILEYAKVYFKFTMRYDSHYRQGGLDNARGFINVDLQLS